MNKDKKKVLTIYCSPFGYGKTYFELLILQKENEELKEENNLLKKQLKKYNKIKEMFESGVVDLIELKNIILKR